MSSSLRRGTLAATALTLSVLTLSACGAGNDAQTLQIKPDNAAVHVGDIKIQNANVVTAPDGSGAATVTGRIFNDGTKDETLESVTVRGAGQAKLSPAEGEKKVTVPAGGSLALGGEGNASALLENAGGKVGNGSAQPVTFSLSSTGAVKLRATVVPATHQYEKSGPSVQPSPSGSASASESAGASEDQEGQESAQGAEGDASGKPSTGASESASGSESQESQESADGGANAGH
ncbi:copper chaperone PCu(A)C [Streptomyces daliensis]|uniref:DUF461 domain-containing protein n=1 Tax=Streptomyces daliensis TaxID=299421 RepID=A0A8T4IQ23_9ACTN|nr:DUF461 domain-containing protein [Streptomyces daliensis]